MHGSRSTLATLLRAGALAAARIVGQCWLCGQPGPDFCGCCHTCFADLPRPPPRNLRPVGSVDYCDTWLAALYYQAPVEGWVKRFKFQAQPMLRQHFATLIAAQALAYHKHQRLPLPDYLVAVPMPFKRWRQRGYNQARLLANSVGQLLGIPVCDVLQIERVKAQQHQLNKASRTLNVAGAYGVKGSINGGHWVIIDDIITTGATLNSAALALHNAGAEQVSGWALAYTPAPDH